MADPWMKFYPSDWISEPKLKLVSRAARSLWIDMLCLMHQSGTGRLEIMGRPMTEKELSSILGDNPRTVKKLLAELACAGVSIIVHGSFVGSSRIIRDFEKAERDRSNGRMGGNPALQTRENEHLGVNPEDKAQKLEARSQSKKNDEVAREAEKNQDHRSRLLKAIGADPISGMIGPNGVCIGTQADMAEARKWTEAGITETEQIEEISRIIIKRRSGSPPPRSFSYFSQPMADLAEAKKKPMPIGSANHGIPRQDDRTRKINQWNKIAAGGSQ